LVEPQALILDVDSKAIDAARPARRRGSDRCARHAQTPVPGDPAAIAAAARISIILITHVIISGLRLASWSGRKGGDRYQCSSRLNLRFIALDNGTI
jgi:hypothetical protein